MTPVSRWSTSLTVGASESVLLTEDRVVTGTWSPTSSLPVWLSSTTMDGAESTLTSVISFRALRATVASLFAKT